MYERLIQSHVLGALRETPAVVLTGPRQVGKTTLALSVGRALAGTRESLYLDLESDADLARLAQPELYLADHRDQLLILDEVQRTPQLFGLLRGQIDRARRAGQRHGLYLLLGSASMALLRQSGESLAGRVAHLELAPLTLAEATGVAPDEPWLRGGYPESLLAADAPPACAGAATSSAACSSATRCG